MPNLHTLFPKSGELLHFYRLSHLRLSSPVDTLRFLVQKECILSPSISDKSGFLSQTASIHFEMAVPPEMFRFEISGTPDCRKTNKSMIHTAAYSKYGSNLRHFHLSCRFAPFGKIPSLSLSTLQSQFESAYLSPLRKMPVRSSCRHFCAAPLHTAPKSQLEQR